MITAILLYLIIAAFLAGWWFGADWAQSVNRPYLDRAGIVGLALVWPYTFVIFLKMRWEGKL